MMAEQDILKLAQQDFAELNETEARALTDEIKGAADQLWKLLSEAHNRKAWKALGYETWDVYVSAEFNMSRRHSYRLLDQASVIKAIESAASEMCPSGHIEVSTMVEISEAVARDIKPVLDVVTSRIREEVANIAPEKVQEMVQTIVQEERAKVVQIADWKRENKETAERLGLKADAARDRLEDQRTATMYPLYRAIESVAALPDPIALQANVKPYEQKYLDLVPRVIEWLQKFAGVQS